MKRMRKGALASLLALACLGMAALGVFQATGRSVMLGRYLQAGDGIQPSPQSDQSVRHRFRSTFTGMPGTVPLLEYCHIW